MKVVVTSRESIKPLCPTPDHLRFLLLSYLDQINNPNFVPFIYFYPSPSNGFDHFQRSHRLKKSLSEILTSFYPLAGRLKNNLFIDCDDDGVYYVEAEVKCQLSEVIDQPNNVDLNIFLPFYELDNAGDLLLAVQVNFFDCGGMAIGTLFSHKIADALSMVTFVNCWAAAASGGDHLQILSPKFDLAMLFPPRDLVSVQTRTTGISKEKFVAKTFVFSPSAISALKAKHPINSTLPSRVEALTTFIWSRFVVAANLAGRSYAMTQGVNLRTRMNPKLPEFCFGNLSCYALVGGQVMDTESIAEASYALVAQLRDATRKIDGDYVKKRQVNKLQLNSPKQHSDRIIKEEVFCMSFSSVIRFPLYEPDFGWGRPIWVTMATQPFQNLVVFLPTKSGDGIEALINMKVDDMAKLEADKEFLAFASPTLDSKFLFRSSL